MSYRENFRTGGVGQDTFLSDKVLYNEEDVGHFAIAAAITAFAWDGGYWEHPTVNVDTNSLKDFNLVQISCQAPDENLTRRLLKYSRFPIVPPDDLSRGWDFVGKPKDWNIKWEQNFPVDVEAGIKLFEEVIWNV